MKEFRITHSLMIIFVLSILNAVRSESTDSLSLSSALAKANDFCRACECDESNCRLDALEKREKDTLQFIIGFLQEKLHKLDTIDDFCLDCGTCHYWAEANCPTFTGANGAPKIVNAANFQSTRVSEEVCCMDPTSTPTHAPTPIPIVATCKDWDCQGNCNRENDPAMDDAPALNCFSCCKETCEDWQPFQMCPLRHQKVNIGNLHRSGVDLKGNDFDAMADSCCEDIPAPPTPPTPTCQNWFDDGSCAVDDPATKSCPNGKVFNLNLLNSEAWSCDECTEPTCKVFDCKRYGKINDPEKDCELSLTPEDCCKRTCEGFHCHFHGLEKDHYQKRSTTVNKENCCIPNCDSWRAAGHYCPKGEVFDQTKKLTKLPSKNFNAQTGWGTCCVHHCAVLECPPGLSKCDSATYTSRPCTDSSKFPDSVVERNICRGGKANIAVGCQRMSAFWQKGYDVWDCCECQENLHLQIPGIPVWDDERGHEFHCMELPKEREHFYCADILDKAGDPKPACRVTIGGINFCHRVDTLKTEHRNLDCDQEWQGGLNAPDGQTEHKNSNFEHKP